MQLTTHFSLKELTKSQEGTRLGIKEQFEPAEDIKQNLTTLCEKVLQPLRDALKSAIVVNSGYRCSKVNKIIGGAKTSQHVKGQAADLEFYEDGKENNFKIAQEVLRTKIIFDQMILEYGTFEKPEWIHISYDSTKPMQRGQILRAETINGKTQYSIIEADKIWH